MGIFGGIFLLAARSGFSYLIGNQTTYFLYGLRLYDPTFIPRDWYTWDTFQYHFAYGYLVYFLQILGPLRITSVIAQLITMIILSFGLLNLSKRFCAYPISTFLAFITWMGVYYYYEIGLGWQSLIMGYSQPLEIAGACMILGLSLIFKRYYFFSGIMLGVGGLFHASILASFAPIILVTALATKIWKNIRQLIAFALPLCFLWGILASVVIYVLLHAPPDPSAMSIIVHLRNPYDLILANWDIKCSFNWLVWVSMGGVAIYALPTDQKYKELKISFYSSLAFIGFIIFQMAFIKISSITGMMLWRAAPWVVVLGLIIALDRCIHFLKNKFKDLQSQDKFVIIFFILAIFALLSFGWRPFASKSRLLWLTAIPLSIGIGYLLNLLKIYSLNRYKVFLILLFVIIATSSISGIKNTRDYSSPSIAYQAEEAQMEEWVRENTPKDALFITPMSVGHMRVRGERALIVEWKSTSSIPSDLRKWYHRLLDVSGFPRSTPPTEITEELLEEGYLQFDTARAKLLQERYGANYIVVSTKNHLGNLEGLIEHYRNEKFRVLEIPTHQISPGN